MNIYEYTFESGYTSLANPVALYLTKFFYSQNTGHLSNITFLFGKSHASLQTMTAPVKCKCNSRDRTHTSAKSIFSQTEIYLPPSVNRSSKWWLSASFWNRWHVCRSSSDKFTWILILAHGSAWSSYSVNGIKSLRLIQMAGVQPTYLEWKLAYFYLTETLKFAPKEPVDSRSALVQVMF